MTSQTYSKTQLDSLLAGKADESSIPTSGSTGPTVTDNGDGTYTISGPGVTDNGDGTFSIGTGVAATVLGAAGSANTYLAHVGTATSPVTDPATARPTAAVVYWLCAAGVTPANATAGDLIWNANA